MQLQINYIYIENKLDKLTFHPRLQFRLIQRIVYMGTNTSFALNLQLLQMWTQRCVVLQLDLEINTVNNQNQKETNN